MMANYDSNIFGPAILKSHDEIRTCVAKFESPLHDLIAYLKYKILDVFLVDLERRIEPAIRVSRRSSSTAELSARMMRCVKLVSGDIETKSSTSFGSKAGTVAQFCEAQCKNSSDRNTPKKFRWNDISAAFKGHC